MQAVGEAVETPERLWTPAMKAATAEELAHLANQAHAAQVCWSPSMLALDCLVDVICASRGQVGIRYASAQFSMQAHLPCHLAMVHP